MQGVCILAVGWACAYIAEAVGHKQVAGLCKVLAVSLTVKTLCRILQLGGV
jgi:hypothetical protein